MSTPTVPQPTPSSCSHSAPPPKDPVENPSHYTFSSIEVIDAIEAWGCDFLEGNIIKYVARWKRKDGVQDLKKAAWYLKRLIDRETNSTRNTDVPANS